MLQRLSAQSFVSMTIERLLDLPAHPDVVSLVSHPSSQSNSRFYNEIHIGNVKYPKAIEYLKGPEQEADSHLDEHRPYNVFEAGTPGAMSLDEMAREIDLGQWRLDVRDRIVRLKVMIRKLQTYKPAVSDTLQDLVVWDDSDLSDSDTIKGITAELASCIGPELVKETTLKFHD